MKKAQEVKYGLVELEAKIKKCNAEKQRIYDYLQGLKEKWIEREISYADYERIVNEKRNGKNIREWIEYYDWYIEECEKRKKSLNRERKKSAAKKITGFIVLFILFATAIMILLSYQPSVFFAPPAKIYTDNLSLIFENSQEYIWNVENYGELASVRISGFVEGNGTARIYLEDRLVLDSAELEVSRTNSITGFDISEFNDSNSTSGEEENASTALPGPENDAQANASLPLEENMSLIEENLTEEQNITIEIPVKEFFEYCAGTCGLSGLGLNKTSYTLRIEIEGDAKLNLNSVTYEISKEIETKEISPKIIKNEEKTSRGKRVRISSETEIQNAEISSDIPESWNIRKASSLTVYWVEENNYIDFFASDNDNDGKIDKINWTAPHLSNQTFDIIVITQAEHLDSNKNFLSDIFPEIEKLDGIWSETIFDNEYVRVLFEKNLTSDRDITLYPRIISGKPKIEIYEAGGTEIIAEFEILNSDEYNKILLGGLAGEQDSFDLKIVGGKVEIDYIIDPAAEPGAGVELRPQTCYAQDIQKSANVFLDPCDGFYPNSNCDSGGDYISCADNILEIHAAERRYGGIKSEYFNPSITNCGAITKVEICYASWLPLGQAANQWECTIAVDNDKDNTWQPVTTSCNVGSAPVVCTDISDLEDWACNNFFGAGTMRAEAKAQARKIAGRGITLDYSIDALYYRLSYSETNLPPTIVSVIPTDPVSLIAGGTADIFVQFTAEDSNGASDLIEASAHASFTKTGEVQRDSVSCVGGAPSGNQITYTCSVPMEYYDAAGMWGVTVSVGDAAGAQATDSSKTFIVNLLQDILITSGSPINFGTVIPGTQVVAPVVEVTNTGNYEGTIDVTAYDLIGPATIFTENFRAAGSNEASSVCTTGDQLQSASATTITSTTLLRGDGISKDNTETLSFCLDVPSDIIPGTYTATGGNAWKISVLVFVLFAKKKRKKKDRMGEALKLVAEELKEKYSEGKERIAKGIANELAEKYKLSQKEIFEKLGLRKEESIPVSIFSKELGGLEALCKYLKENLGRTYHEIAEEISRDDRTVWTAYNKAKSKNVKIKVDKSSMQIPVSILKNRRLTIFESVIVYLKKKDWNREKDWLILPISFLRMELKWSLELLWGSIT
ncbi:MAG: hypothetical protein UU25_C0012G0003, partial [Microgenomates group bacterium GW2011_GWB1_40_9]